MTSLYVMHLFCYGHCVELGQALYSEEGSTALYSARMSLPVLVLVRDAAVVTD